MSSDNGWVVDGNYTRRIGTVAQDNATDIICELSPCFHQSFRPVPVLIIVLGLDPPLLLYFPRLFHRTVLRLLYLVPPCSAGCSEDYREVFFSRKSILWWCLSNHWVARNREQAKFRLEGVHVGGRRRRIGGWGTELATWKQSVREMLRNS